MQRQLNKLFEKIFDAFDTSGDGRINVRELWRFLRELGVNMTTMDIVNIITLFDENNDGLLDKPEFNHFMYVAMNSNPENLPAMLFFAADTDHSGTVDSREFIKIMMKLGCKLPKEELLHLLLQFTDSPDQSISYLRFVDLVTEFIKD
ncbi:Calmodulin [Spironucleus salmonicida]|uniref:Calmodulin n=2 Tax=Spironucleus TaxID=39709 RepID=V6LSS1_9EUKA|nr:calmodulin [Spironucleus barkhanus]KAH0570868.1 Calmodulin [Spironucleus salmonicida]KAH0570870.1 Calmodulin [Spironucleus salmonicida]|eukprot:EST43839.1 Calmodulin [Spironucleus salmonicida]